MPQAGDRRLFVFLALSIALHALWLVLPMRTRTATEAMMPEPLNIHLVPSTPVEKSAMVTRQAKRGIPTTRAPDATIIQADTTAPEPATPAINLDAALATARAQAREAQPRTALDAPKPQLTVEAAVAHAMQRQALVETRGAAGEYVTMNGNSRCVTPLVVPHFLEGKTMLTQCEARKG